MFLKKICILSLLCTLALFSDTVTEGRDKQADTSLEAPLDKDVINTIYSMDISSHSGSISEISRGDSKASISKEKDELSSVLEEERVQAKPCVIDVDALGKGDSLTEEEINQSLLDFVLEEERLRKEKEDRENKLKKELSKLEEKLKIIKNKNVELAKHSEEKEKERKLSLEEQKNRLGAGLSQFPNVSSALDGGANSILELPVVEVPMPKIYGVWCKAKKCSILSEGGVLKKGDFFRGEEKITKITKKYITTSKETFEISTLNKRLEQADAVKSPASSKSKTRVSAFSSI